MSAWPSQKILQDFPALHQEVNGQRLVYLDSAASALKPRVVIERLEKFYRLETANVHRGVHTLSARATAEFENGRHAAAQFLNASAEEIVFTKGTTESINLVAQTWGRKNLQPGDVVLLSEMEHHSNIVPWQMVCAERGAEVKVVPVLSDGSLDLAAYDVLLKQRVKMVALAHVSNTLGTINPVRDLVKKAKAAGALTLLDGAQAVTCLPVDVRDLDCDFYVFSGHKTFGPYGVGVLFGRTSVLGDLPPYQGGGSMISEVTFAASKYLEAPLRFEAGTPNISGVIGLVTALTYLRDLDLRAVAEYEDELLQQATRELQKIGGLKILGTAKNKAAIISFTVDGVHANDVGEILDKQGVAVRVGHHCTQPLLRKFGLTATVRASFSIYNTAEDVDVFVQGVRRAREMLR